MNPDVEVLNRLIDRLRAAAMGYRAAGSDGVVGFKDTFDANAAAHDRTADLLGEEVRSLGGQAAEGARRDGAPHGWTRLGPALAQGPRAVLEAIEQGEAELLAAFHEAMDDDETSGPARDAIVRACDGMRTRHDAALKQLNAIGA